jgi:hypothetical protein
MLEAGSERAAALCDATRRRLTHVLTIVLRWIRAHEAVATKVGTLEVVAACAHGEDLAGVVEEVHGE